MLPSPGFSIPSIGTPLHQPEEDQQIIANNQYSSFGSMNMGGGSMGNNQMGGSNISHSNNSGMSSLQSMGLPSLMHTPIKQIHNSYQPSYATPHSMIQPQTPVNYWFSFFSNFD